MVKLAKNHSEVLSFQMKHYVTKYANLTNIMFSLKIINGSKLTVIE